MKASRRWIAIALILGSCNSLPNSPAAPIPPENTATAPAASSTPTAAPEAQSEPEPEIQSEIQNDSEYQRQYDAALQLASNTAKLVQQAQSSDDWGLIVSRWQRTLEQLKAIPASASNHTTAQSKISEYERNLAYAEQQLNQLNNPPDLVPLGSGLVAAQESGGSAARFTVQIVSRSRGTPVIMVTFNGGPAFPMILDTGASGTFISRDAANQLGLRGTGQVTATTASDRSVTLETTQVRSITVGNITRGNLTVAIGDAIPIGLLGNDFHRGYDLNIRESTVEFVRR